MKDERKRHFLSENVFREYILFNQDRTKILAPLRFFRQDGLNDISFDPFWSTSKFALRAYMESSDPGHRWPKAK